MAVSRNASARHSHRRALPSKSTELMIVVVGILILLLIAAPTYLSVVGRAHNAAARANVRTAVPAVEAYFLLANNTYAGLDLQWLQTYQPGVALNDPAATPTKQTATSYCVSSTIGGKTWYKAGPGAPITTTPC